MVLPAYQQQGIAKAMGKVLLSNTFKMHPVSAYYWDGEDPDFIPEALGHYGFRETGRQPVVVYGANNYPLEEVSMQANSAYGVLKKLSQKQSQRQ